MIVLHQDLRACRYCNRGSREWFRDHDLDWAEFISHGLPEESFSAFNDALVTAVLNQARDRINNA